MTPNEFLTATELPYANYQAIRKQYSHVASFAYWPETFAAHPQEARDLIVDDEATYQAKLAHHLHNGVVILGLNFGESNIKQDKKVIDTLAMSVDERLAFRRSLSNMNNQYRRGDAYRTLYPTFDTHAGHMSVFHGAYMTDLFKFWLDEGDQWLAGGIPTAEGDTLAAKLKLNPGLMQRNLDGLRYELRLAGVPERFIMVLLGSQLQNRYQSALAEAFPQATIVGTQHYKTTSVGGKPAWDAENNALNEKVEQVIANW